MATIAIVNSPYTGHLVPATRLGAVLAGRGHRVIAWGMEHTRHEIEAAGLEMRVLAPEPERPPVGDWAQVADLLATAAAHVSESLIEQMLAEHVDLVVHDTMAPVGRLAARWLGLPTVGSCPIFMSTTTGRGRIEVRDQEAVRSVLETLTAVQRRWGVDLGPLPSVLVNTGDVNLSYTIAEILGEPLPDASWHFVGSLRESGAADAPAPRNPGDRPLVYMSLGTMARAPSDLFRAVMEGLKDEPVRLVLATAGRVSESELGDPPPNATVLSRLDSRGQHAIMGEASLYVTHSGTGSAHDALFAGVPMVCMPIFGDQRPMAQRIDELGAGEILADRTPEGIRAAVRRMLGDERAARRARELGERLRAYDGASVAIGAVEGLLP
jgi:MGT family glycosyltransferase